MNYTLEIEDNDELDYLLGIHSYVSDYKLAYLLNLNMGLCLKKNLQGLKVNKSKEPVFFNYFEYDNSTLDQSWFLFNNKLEHKPKSSKINQSLFDDSLPFTTLNYYLIKAHKKVDYFLKISGLCSESAMTNIKNKINTIEAIQLCYAIDINKSNTKDYLTV